jgi:hypothetical protein
MSPTSRKNDLKLAAWTWRVVVDLHGLEVGTIHSP